MSNSTRINELKGVTNGLSLIGRKFYDLKRIECEHYINAFLRKDFEHLKLSIESKISEAIAKTPQENLENAAKKVEAFAKQANTLLQSDLLRKNNPFSNVFSDQMQKRAIHYSLNRNFDYLKYKRVGYLYNRQLRLLSSTTTTPDIGGPATIKPNENTAKNVPKFKQKVILQLKRFLIQLVI